MSAPTALTLSGRYWRPSKTGQNDPQRSTAREPLSCAASPFLWPPVFRGDAHPRLLFLAKSVHTYALFRWGGWRSMLPNRVDGSLIMPKRACWERGPKNQCSFLLEATGDLPNLRVRIPEKVYGPIELRQSGLRPTRPAVSCRPSKTPCCRPSCLVGPQPMRTGSNSHENVSMPPSLGNLKLNIGGKHLNRLSPKGRVIIST